MTKEELGNQITENEQMLEQILPLSDGQECLIYKAAEFSVSDEIIYIPDIYLNGLAFINRRDGDDVESYAQRVVENCYTGQDFMDECGGNVELAERLFHYCDWQHPSSALTELDEIDKDEVSLTTQAHMTEQQGDVPFDMEVKRQLLIERVQENYANYRAELLLKERQELIDGADRIAKTAEVFQYFTGSRFTEGATVYFLKFQNPLEVATDHWDNCDFELDALDAVIADAVDKESDLVDYPLVTDAPVEKPSSLRKFMNVDLEKFFPQIMAQITAFHQKDLDYALDTMREGITSVDPCKRGFVIIFRQSGVDLLNERDMFIAGTQSYNTCQHYHRHTSEKVLAYSVQLVGIGTDGLRGNLYQQDQHQMALFAERAASPYTDVTITFLGGREVRIPEKDYNFTTVPNLEYRYGTVLDTRNEAEDESVVQGALEREYIRRERMPMGHIAVHVQELESSRIQMEADRLASELQILSSSTIDKMGGINFVKAMYRVTVSPQLSPASFAILSRAVNFGTPRSEVRSRRLP